jgi:hypothetical protein
MGRPCLYGREKKLRYDHPEKEKDKADLYLHMEREDREYLPVQCVSPPANIHTSIAAESTYTYS